MLIQKYPLYNFVRNLPSCFIDDAIAVVLKIFEQERCDRLIVTDRQNIPMGILHLASFLPYYLCEAKSDKLQNYEDKVSNPQHSKSSSCLTEGFSQTIVSRQLLGINKSLIQPVYAVPISLKLDKLNPLLNSQSPEISEENDCVIVDSEGRYLGLLNILSLFKYLMAQNEPISREEERFPFCKIQVIDSDGVDGKDEPLFVEENFHCEEVKCRLILQLLEKLPLPLMLQTGSGEVITQNPAWWQQLGTLQDPEGVRRQVENILNPQENHKSHRHVSQKFNNDSKLSKEVANLKQVEQDVEYNTQEENLTARLHPVHLSVLSKEEILNQHSALEKDADSWEEECFSDRGIKNSKLNHCYFDSNTGSCICVVQVQNGNERVWQFTKIPLNDSESHSFNSSESLENIESKQSKLWLMLATDVTEQQQLSQELAAKNADLIQLNRLKDEFLACISHELKTPLTAVLGLSRLLIDQQLGKLNERQARYAGLIHQSGKHLMSVVNDILDLTRMETGQITLTLQTIKIRAVCERAIAEAKNIHDQSSRVSTKSPANSLSGKEQEISLSIEPELDEIIADELRLRQMISHLLSNALKFTDVTGDIGLSVNRWEGWIAITIWDTGIGIPEHQQHLIFQKFRQLENPLTRQFEGAGLGLVLTRALARLHGGDVSFLSTEGKGSQFTVLLPPSPPNTNTSESSGKHFGLQEKETVSRTKSKTHHQPTFSQRLVMVVEPVARYIEDFTQHLSRLGYRIVVARSGCEALEKARRLQPKVIFLNPFLSNLSGWDVLTLLKSDTVTRNIPVIVTATGAEKEKAFSRQADGFLSLPVQKQHLEPLLENLCGTPDLQTAREDNLANVTSNNPLRVLRLVTSDLQSLHPHPSLLEHRVIEVDDLEQAELMARVWQFDVVLLDSQITQPEDYLQQLSKKKRLASLPLVTCTPEITQAASNISNLSVFPCLSPLNSGKVANSKNTLLSVLQIAAGVCCPPNILVVDLIDISSCESTKKTGSKLSSPEKSVQYGLSASLSGEWFQALIQYLQTAGFKAGMSSSWMELNEQIRYHSTDLLLVCLSDIESPEQVSFILEQINKLPVDLPPVILIDRQIHNFSHSQARKSPLGKIKKVLDNISTETLPRSVSMEDLLYRIHQTLNIVDGSLVDSSSRR